jgi:predicted lipid-binding transport protein (Tim44 family)
MSYRNILSLIAASAVLASPALAQQKTPQPMKTVASVSRDTTHKTVHKHRRSSTRKSVNAATPATPATPANPTVKPATPATAAAPTVKPEQKTAEVKHKTAKHSTRSKSKKSPADTTKRS